MNGKLKQPIMDTLKNKNLSPIKHVCVDIFKQYPLLPVPKQLLNLFRKNEEHKIIDILQNMREPNFKDILNTENDKNLKQTLFSIFVTNKVTRNTALHYAASIGDVEFTKFLLNGCKDKLEAANLQNILGFTPLHYASAFGNYEISKILIENGAGVNLRTTDSKTPLHFAAQNGHFRTSRLLLDHGASIQAKDEYGFTPTRYATGLGHKNLALALQKELNKGDLNIVQNQIRNQKRILTSSLIISLFAFAVLISFIQKFLRSSDYILIHNENQICINAFFTIFENTKLEKICK
jgi:hypothetical protein